MRFSKHVLPIAILLTGVIAAKDEESTTAVEKAKATDDKASATADGSKTADATEEASATATGKDDKKDSKTDKSDTKSATKEKSATSQTTADGPTITWDPPAPKTTVPDINAGSPSPMTPGVVVLSLVLGITSLGMALL
ncbi:hypothetical protein DER46DRAFT_618324 [Fusarium sp. MPI-SDFR-AT-0072]|uniref:Uncharacterized protein n=1 Tax=Fusarium oxysporum f. sp. rapae TaxID=485398 RepID=A0A8J5NZ43_FUSOX|nr:hypothetical protein Forpe1208_v010429 [Fusarium oxysporum f. sp. rapae]KAH7143064.1 hypothetical protein DER46DRAFT_618324 [Fusarium sp. MPI-SDFR-AT-0072]KAI7765400.1 hypothetical protein LZL87_007151 [Fusarium oxysporum]